MGDQPQALAGLVPYVTRWSTEHTSAETVIIQQGRLAYSQEWPWDRDQHGVLWARVPLRRGQGRPEFGKVHPRRQRAAMTRLWCQVCGQAADHTSDGYLWLTGEDPNDRDNWPDPLETADPPLCVPCAAKAVQLCPMLRRCHTALRVQQPSPVAVRGRLYQPWPTGPVPVGVTGVYLDDPRAQWILAGQLIVALHQFTITTLSTAHGCAAAAKKG
jgi:ferredoxin